MVKMSMIFRKMCAKLVLVGIRGLSLSWRLGSGGLLSTTQSASRSARWGWTSDHAGVRAPLVPAQGQCALNLVRACKWE
ncbi:hypothetical protein BDV98DRAFT_567917 [Pterulicium gracile]|uniref:Uncharacterized protein n=1 Tax=Pterulicium gracile TaxID=1884261 RepID=A0A5C3QJK4_9AGAR|nr:hypothetical protein BDV98DRAFT_567917 [Pterula gracilis]